ncbi:hypothetical protein LguiA_022707 [Lonicera macranthoides]
MNKNSDQLQLRASYGNYRFSLKTSRIDSVELIFSRNQSWTLAFTSFILGDLLILFLLML